MTLKIQSRQVISFIWVCHATEHYCKANSEVLLQLGWTFITKCDLITIASSYATMRLLTDLRDNRQAINTCCESATKLPRFKVILHCINHSWHWYK